MAWLRNRLTALFATGAALVLTAPALHAQAMVLPHPGYQLPASTQIGAATANWAQLTQMGNQLPFYGGFNSGPLTYGGYNPYGGYYPWNYYGGYMDPNYGYLSGAASVINAQGQYLMQYQQSQLLQEQVKQQKLDTRRKTFEEWRYEQSMLPTAEELRARQEKAALDRALNNPPSVDIWSGDALNTILRDIQKNHSGATGPTVLLDPAVLQKISVTDGSTFGQGLLKEGGKLTWPYALEFEFFAPARKQMDQAMAQAVGQVTAGKRVDAKVVQTMLDTENTLRDLLKQHIHDLTPSQGVEARRYLNEVHETIRTLQDPNAANYVTGKWAPRGRNVTELVDGMTKNSLKFAPAGSGNEAAYTALYQAMVSYDRLLAPYARR